jgi:hypothetical protein
VPFTPPTEYNHEDDVTRAGRDVFGHEASPLATDNLGVIWQNLLEEVREEATRVTQKWGRKTTRLWEARLEAAAAMDMRKEPVLQLAEAAGVTLPPLVAPHVKLPHRITMAWGLQHHESVLTAGRRCLIRCTMVAMRAFASVPDPTSASFQLFWREANEWLDMVAMAVEDDYHAYAGWLLTEAARIGWYPTAAATVYRAPLTTAAIFNHKGRSVEQHLAQMARRRPVVKDPIGGPTPTALRTRRLRRG